jgi:hypothetical protein
MIGVVLVVLALVLVGPILIMLAGAVWSALVGWLVLDDVEHEHPSEVEPEHA